MGIDGLEMGKDYTVGEIARIVGAKVSGGQRLRDGSGLEAVVKVLLTDSRRLLSPEGSLYFALKTPANDGHKYIGELYALGVRHFVVSDVPGDGGAMGAATFLQVESPLRALQILAAEHRQRYTIPVVGITGSNGKTVVKEFLYQLLREEFNIVRSPRSYNSQLGVPLSVWQMNERHRLGIFEAGISQPDEMVRLASIIAPTVGVLTTIGGAHQENFTSPFQKCIEKLRLFAHSEAIVYDGDNDFITHCVEASLLSHKAIAWSRINSEAPLYIQSVKKQATGTEIVCRLMGLPATYRIPFTDDASIENVIHCIALMLYLKPSSLRNADKFACLEPVDMRLDVKEGKNDCLLINDAYNADIDALDIALDFQQSRQTDRRQKRTLILSDILQSGLHPRELYKKVAERLRRKGVNRLVGIGPDISSCAALFDSPKEFFPSTDAFLASPTANAFHNELILLKGSRRFHFERIAEALEMQACQTVLEVDLDAIVHNLDYFRSLLAPQTRIIAMVKAFGYGVGHSELAKTLQARHCDYLAVALADEGADLRKNGIAIPIIVMNPEQSALRLLLDNLLEPEIYNFRLLELLIEETQRRGITDYPVHIKIDSGMHRLGFQPADLPALAQRLQRQNALIVRSVFSHLAAADNPQHDNFTHRQADCFLKAAQDLETALGYKIRKHILNSAGILRFPQYQFDAVRLGIALYGINPLADDNPNLTNVASLRTTILQIQNVPQGHAVGYGQHQPLTKPSRIAVIPIGYADGLDRRLGNGNAHALVHNHLCPTVGNICMDLTMLDITDVPNTCEGDSVLIFGHNLPIQQLAERLHTIPYEILASLSQRIKRIYFRQ